MEPYKKLLMANRAWALDKRETEPEFFESISQGQSPDFLWIGCSDSRVPAEEITGAQPGEIFVHRNIANLFIPSDINVSSVVEYAVTVLKVKHIILCGHYGCGGVRAALTQQTTGVLDQWLSSIKGTYSKNLEQLKSLSEEEQWARMVEINVEHQVQRLSLNSTLQEAWKMGSRITLHGWVFDLGTGLIKTISTHDSVVET